MGEGIIDGLTNMDELLREILVAIRGQDIATKGMGVSRLVSLAKEKQDRELKIVFFTYPYDGTQVTLAAGTTEIDFTAGTVKDTSGTVTDLQHSLRTEGKDFLRSLYINTDKAIKVQLDSGDIIFCDEEKDLQATYMVFTKVKITTTENTQLSLLACTNPEAILTLVDKASQVSGGSRVVYGKVLVETADATTFPKEVFLTTTPSLYIPIFPATTQKFRINSIRYYLSPANAVTFRLRLLEQISVPGTAPDQARADVIYDSGASMAKDTEYIEIGGGVLPIEVTLTDTAKLYYLIEYSAACGNADGYIVIRGDKLS